MKHEELVAMGDDLLTKGKYILDNDNNSIPVTSLYEWGEWMQNASLRRILCITIVQAHPEIYVSTIFLGMDHAWRFEENDVQEPILWETMVFGHIEEVMYRYTSRDAAIEGHLSTVDEIRHMIK